MAEKMMGRINDVAQTGTMNPYNNYSSNFYEDANAEMLKASKIVPTNSCSTAGESSENLAGQLWGDTVTGQTFYGSMLDERFKSYVDGLIEPLYWNGILYPGLIFKPQVFADLQNYQFQPEDIIIATYPKSGTTWTAEIVSLLMHPDDESYAKNLDISQRVIHFEAPPERNVKNLDSIPKPRIFQTHLQHPYLPPSIIRSQCKIIYVLRNPKDVAVSFFHHHRMALEVGYFNKDFKHFLSLFLEGKIILGSWFDHVKSYWKRKDDTNLLIVRYEDMINNLNEVIMTISKFLGVSLSRSQIANVSNACTFEKMKDNERVNRNWVPLFDQTKSKFIRKGIIGDWKNHFSQEDNNIFDTIYKSKMDEISDLDFIYE
ncbi:unnamed protein product [Gordionus sp. m RMFG-2023]|uniref:sulfotransferase 1C2A-like n=1 Tax=Gordionus sp. m RMFG-2023 TaxID=3053472 RepID=UPI0030DFB109